MRMRACFAQFRQRSPLSALRSRSPHCIFRARMRACFAQFRHRSPLSALRSSLSLSALYFQSENENESVLRTVPSPLSALALALFLRFQNLYIFLYINEKLQP
jgi:hypothetical protein